jgi:hypothetical protein
MNYIRSRLLHIGVEHTLLLKVVGHGVLCQEWGLEADFGADPFAFGVRSVGGMIAAPAAAELGTEVGALDLIELLDFAPGFVAYRSGYVNFESHYRHNAKSSPQRARRNTG